MSTNRTKEEYEAQFQRTKEKMLGFPGMTEEEALVLTMSLLSPRGWQDILKTDYKMKKDKSMELFQSGTKKYLAGGGKDHWQG